MIDQSEYGELILPVIFIMNTKNFGKILLSVVNPSYMVTQLGS